jgi:hypothetical protein
LAEARQQVALTGQALVDYAARIQRNATQVMAEPAPTAVQEANFVDSEVPTGTINGVNKVFVLANTPAAGLKVYRDGLRTTDYVLATATITFGTTAPATSVLCDYRV